MKSLFLATAAVAAFAAAPALAQSGPVGSVGVTYSNTDVEIAGLEGDAQSYAVDGVVAVDAFAGWTATFAGRVAHNDDLNNTTIAGTAHLTRLIGSDLRVGGFVGASDLGSENAYTAGAEVQKYLDKVTLSGSLAYTTADDLDIDAWTVGGDAAFYVLPNLRLNAGVSYSSVEILGAEDDVMTYAAGAEYEIASTPFSVAAGFSRAEADQITVDTINVGLRYSFGGGLQARDRAGANLPTTGVAAILSAF